MVEKFLAQFHLIYPCFWQSCVRDTLYMCNMYAGADERARARGVTIIFSLEIEATYMRDALATSCVVRTRANASVLGM